MEKEREGLGGGGTNEVEMELGNYPKYPKSTTSSSSSAMVNNTPIANHSTLQVITTHHDADDMRQNTGTTSPIEAMTAPGPSFVVPQQTDDSSSRAPPEYRCCPPNRDCCSRSFCALGDCAFLVGFILISAYLLLIISLQGAAYGYLRNASEFKFDDLRADWNTAGFVDVVAASSSCPAGYSVWGPKQLLPSLPNGSSSNSGSAITLWKTVKLCVDQRGVSNAYNSPCWQGSCENTVTGIQFIKGTPPSGTPPERIFTHEGNTYSIVTSKTPEHPPLIYFTLNIGLNTSTSAGGTAAGQFCQGMGPGSPLSRAPCSSTDSRYAQVDSYEGIANGARLLYQENGFVAAAMEDQLNGLGSYAFVRSRTAITRDSSKQEGECGAKRFMEAIDRISASALFYAGFSLFFCIGLLVYHFIVNRCYLAHTTPAKAKAAESPYLVVAFLLHTVALAIAFVQYFVVYDTVGVFSNCYISEATPDYRSARLEFNKAVAAITALLYIRNVVELTTIVYIFAAIILYAIFKLFMDAWKFMRGIFRRLA